MCWESKKGAYRFAGNYAEFSADLAPNYYVGVKKAGEFTKNCDLMKTFCGGFHFWFSIKGFSAFNKVFLLDI
jgi:hypothetical protein